LFEGKRLRPDSILKGFPSQQGIPRAYS